MTRLLRVGRLLGRLVVLLFLLRFLFIHESNIYIGFVYELRKRLGLKVVQVYDAFYFEKGAIDERTLEEKMRKCALEYAERYRFWKENIRNR